MSALGALLPVTGAVLRWWLDELWSLVPAAARDALVPPARPLRLAYDDDPLLSAPRRWRRVRLELPDEQVLRRRLSLPLAAAPNLAQVLALQIGRLTPFPREDVVFGWRVFGRDQVGATLDVELVAMRRTVIAAVLDQARAAGIPHRRLEIAARGSAVDLCRPGRPPPLGGQARVNIALLVLVLALGLSSLLVEFGARGRDLAELETELGRAGAVAQQVAELRQVLELTTQQLSLLRAGRQPGALKVAVVDELARRLDDRVSLDSLSMDVDGVELRGIAPQAGEVAALLGAHPLFDAPTFRAPVTQDARGQRFHLTLGWRASGRAL
jgi:general secretion pathway protein L